MTNGNFFILVVADVYVDPVIGANVSVQMAAYKFRDSWRVFVGPFQGHARFASVLLALQIVATFINVNYVDDGRRSEFGLCGWVNGQIADGAITFDLQKFTQSYVCYPKLLCAYDSLFLSPSSYVLCTFFLSSPSYEEMYFASREYK